MNVKIERPGRLGNFLIQIKNSLHIALYYKYNVILPVHPFLNTTYIIINKNVTRNDKAITDKSNFFQKGQIRVKILNLALRCMVDHAIINRYYNFT